MDPEPEVIPPAEQSRPSGLTAIPEWLRIPMVLLVWSLWLPLLFIAGFFKVSWRILCANRLRRFASLGMLAIVILGMVKAIPLTYGRFALTYEAAYLARTSLGRSTAEIRESLTRTAFRHGYSDVIEQGEAFGVETTYDDDGMLLCNITIDFRQRVNCFGLFEIPVRIKTRIVKPVDPEASKPGNWEDRLFGG